MKTARLLVRFRFVLTVFVVLNSVGIWARSFANDFAVPVVSIVATRAETYEPICPNTCEAPLPAPGVFLISRKGGDVSNSLFVMLRVGGTATPGDDYEQLPDYAIIPAGQDSVELYVRAAFDELVEGDESVTMDLLPDPSMSPIEHYRVDPAQNSAKVVIHDRTPPPSQAVVNIVATDPLAQEGGGSAAAINTATFVIRRFGDTDQSLRVYFEIHGSATPGVDYKELSSPVVIPAGASSVALTVIPIDDSEREPPETVVVKLMPSPELNPLPSYTVGQPARAAAIILDKDQPRPSSQRLSDGLFNLYLPLANNGFFRLEESDGLSAWGEVCILPTSEGAVQFIDPESANLPRRFYRIIPVSSDSSP